MVAEENSLQTWLDRHTRPGELFRAEDGAFHCAACANRCVIRPGGRGACRVRVADADGLRVPAGYVAGLACDPIEKKPFFHVLPGADILSFGMFGCDLHCPFCQNWLTSQALQDPAADRRVGGAAGRETTAAQLVDLAVRHGVPAVASTYNEPLITAEWAREIFALAKVEGIRGAFVSNGNATPEVLDYLRPVVDFYKVDLKGFRDEAYRTLGARLESVLDTIRGLVDRGFWVEIVTLVVPGHNDSPEELRDIARFLAGLSLDIPWHVTAFHPDYRMADRPPTSAHQLLTAAEIGREEGLRYVYAGNLPGAVGDWENTRCPGCERVLVRRQGFRVVEMDITGGACPACGHPIAGFWDRSGQVVPPAPAG